MSHSYLLLDNNSDSDSEDSENDPYSNSQIDSEDNYTNSNHDNELDEPATMFEDNTLRDMEDSDVDMRDVQSPEPSE